MTNYKDLTGFRFGRLTVVGIDAQITKRKTYFVCKCDCGDRKSIRSDRLQNGTTSSCGCLKQEQDRINLTKNHSHKMSDSRLYRIWQGMKSRCLNEKNQSYKNYGERGIGLCSEWRKSFINFKDWAFLNGYDERLTIDRINNDKGYSPENCRWTDNKTQSNNRRSNVVVDHECSLVNITELSNILNIDSSTLFARYARGDRSERLFRKPHDNRKKLKGTTNPNSKTTEKQAKLVKEMLNQGLKARQISNNLDISIHIVYDIKRGKTWAWI